MKPTMIALAAGLFLSTLLAPQPERVGGTVTLYLATECPVAAKYTPRIHELVSAFESQGFSFQARFPQASDDPGKVASYARERAYAFACTIDKGGTQALADGVTVVPTVVVRDSKGDIVYRGAIDDARVSDNVRRQYLRDALVAVSSGRVPALATSEAFGCLLQPRPSTGATAVTFATDVAPILYAKCAQCHRPGEVAPFSLMGYEDAKTWSKMIASVTATKRMPPWPARDGAGEFEHENRLSKAEIASLGAWAEAGAPRGNPADEPKPPEFPIGWPLGTPDLELSMPSPFAVGAEGRDEYWNFVIDPKLTEPVHVQAIDVRPGNRKVVHHVIAFLDESGKSEQLAAKGRQGGYQTFGGIDLVPSGALGGWAPGTSPIKTPSDTGILLKPGTKVVLQVHYHKNGVEASDQTKIALYFNKGKVERKIDIAWLANPFIRIPAGDPAKRFSQTLPIPVDVRLYWLMPHMHNLGRKMEATWVKPDGTEETLIAVDKWDFNWQLVYHLKSPKLLPRGSSIRIEAEYDNSAENPLNPNVPPKVVTWGEETTDEMMLLVAGISVDVTSAGARRFLRSTGGS